MKKIIIMLACIVFVSCEKEKKEENPIGEYVYLDMVGCLHTDLKCYQRHFTDYGDNNQFIVRDVNDLRILVSNSYSLHRIKPDEIQESHLEFCCSGCVSDETYNSLQGKILYRKFDK